MVRLLISMTADASLLYIVALLFTNSTNSDSEMIADIFPCTTAMLVSAALKRFSTASSPYMFTSFSNRNSFPPFRKIYNKRHLCRCPLV